jgi:hypothetical protein
MHTARASISVEARKSRAYGDKHTTSFVAYRGNEERALARPRASTFVGMKDVRVQGTFCRNDWYKVRREMGGYSSAKFSGGRNISVSIAADGMT